MKFTIISHFKNKHMKVGASVALWVPQKET